jgi:hypothetical protein
MRTCFPESSTTVSVDILSFRAKKRLTTNQSVVKAKNSISQPNQTNDTSQIPNEIPQNDTIARHEKLSQVTELGLQYVEDRAAKVTILGHKILL